MKYRLTSLTLCALLAAQCFCPGLIAAERGSPILHRKIEIPEPLLTSAAEGGKSLRFGGDLRMGDLTGDGQADFLVYRSADAGIKPCFLGAFDQQGKLLWQAGQGGGQPVRPGSAAIYDIDSDGKSEVICFFLNVDKKAPSVSLANVVIQIRDGASGRVVREAAPSRLTSLRNETPTWPDHPNWVHQRLLIANLRGQPAPRDFIIKLGSTLLAFDDQLRTLWTYAIKTNRRPYHSAYVPAVGDIDGDGRDEIYGGHYLVDHQGKPVWEKQRGPHLDSVVIAPWDAGKVRAIGSGSGQVVELKGNLISELGRRVVPHGQEVRVADFTTESPGPEMMLRSHGHARDVLLVSNDGRILRRFQLNASPNETGMEAVYWNGPKQPAVLYNGGVLWNGDGSILASLPELLPPVGPAKMGWYHAIPANVCGDAREEVVVYNPWDRFVWIYTPAALDEAAFTGYRAGPRQYNVRLMD